MQRVSVLFSEPKIPQSRRSCRTGFPILSVSVLFSEPKIPQSRVRAITFLYAFEFQCSSASRKFLNQSPAGYADAVVLFQCSSASRKFLNYQSAFPPCTLPQRFSALQRAENSSILDCTSVLALAAEFQCSSASRKFLNRGRRCGQRRCAAGFQCSSASRKFLNREQAPFHHLLSVVFQCSSASRKFLNDSQASQHSAALCFSALQRAENSSIVTVDDPVPSSPTFQCSSASRKFLNSYAVSTSTASPSRFSALQRAENSSIRVSRR